MAKKQARSGTARKSRQVSRHAAARKGGTRRAEKATATKPTTPPLTRGVVARRLGISIASVRRLEESKKLNPTPDANGVRIFAEHEIAALATTTKTERPRLDSAERAARSWEMLAKGATIFELVTELRMHPDEATKLVAQFCAPDVVVLPAAAARELAALGFGDANGRVSAATLVAAATTLRSRLRELRQAASPEKKADAPSALPSAPLSAADRAAPKAGAETLRAPSGRSPRSPSQRARASR